MLGKGEFILSSKPEDKRAKRSKKMLKKGLSELLREKSFNKISVKDITERMDMNRGTFYLHYPDVHALLESLEEDMIRDAQVMIDEYLPKIDGGTLQPVFEPVLDYYVEHMEICRALFNDTSVGMFIERLYKLIYTNGADIMHRQFPTASDAQIGYIMSFIVYGLIGLVKEWSDEQMSPSKEELIAMADRLVEGACRSFLL